MAFPKDKVLQLFTKLKRKAKEVESKAVSPSSPSGDGTPIQDLEPDVEELRHSAMNSYRVGSDVNKTDTGFEVV